MRSLVVRVGATMIRTSRLLDVRGTSALCVTVLVTRKKAAISKNETAAII